MAQGLTLMGCGPSAPGGGGPAPSYVALADFVNGSYFAGGAVVTDVTTLFAAISNVGTTFDPANIIPGSGLLNDQPSFIGPFLSDLLDLTGFTLVIDFDARNETDLGFGLETGDSSNYNHELDGVAGTGGVADPTYLYNDAHQSNASDNNMTANAHNKIALTITPTAMAISVNGGMPFTAIPDTPSSYSQIAIANTFQGGANYTRSFTIYRPVADVDLPALSAL